MKSARLSIALSLVGLLTACGGSDTGTLSVQLKDAPSSDVSQAWVTITDVNLVGSKGPIRLGPTQAVTVDLLTLAAQTASLVRDAVVPVGTYTELRFVISGGCIEVGGTWYAASPNAAMPTACSSATNALRMPSMGQSGLKVTMSGNSLDVQAGSKVLVVDFDVAQSFGVDAGASNAWVMHPVITGGDITVSGNVTATVALATNYSATAGLSLGNCTVSLTSTTDSTVTYTSTITGGTGTAVLYPPAGTYTPALTCQLCSSTNTCSIATVVATWSPSGNLTVNEGQASPIAFTITSATAL